MIDIIAQAASHTSDQAAASNPTAWYIMVTIVGVAFTIAVSVVGMLFASLKKTIDNVNRRMDAHDDKLVSLKGEQEKLQTQMANRKIGCSQEYVTAEQHIRTEAHNRQLLERLVSDVASLKSTMQISEQLPSVCGEVVRQVLKSIQQEKQS